MGFWHTSYMDHHQDTGWGSKKEYVPEPEIFVCMTCHEIFKNRTDRELHSFRGHTSTRPRLLFRNRQCGASRLIVSVKTQESDWALRNAEFAYVNGQSVPCNQVASILVDKTSEIVDVELQGGGNSQSFSFEFSIAKESDLQGSDQALERLIATGELSARTVDEFVMRCKNFDTARDYYSALANYLYGVLIREGSQEPKTAKQAHENSYEGKYDSAVAVLGRFDRAPAEAICGLVAFHYNQLPLAMNKTKSFRVSEASFRLQSMLLSHPFYTGSLTESPHPHLDAALSDSFLEQVLNWSSMPLCISSAPTILEALASSPAQRPFDQFKLRVIAAEIFHVIGDSKQALKHAEYVRYATRSEAWYQTFTSSVKNGVRPS